MKTIIQNKLSSMLDELLQKALEEKPKWTTKEKIVYEYFQIITGRFEGEYFIKYITNSAQRNMKNINNYDLQLTPHQQEIINKIYNKWNKENANNN